MKHRGENMIVQNISGRDIKVPELRKIIKAGSGYISLPYDIAKKYKRLLKPIQMSDTLMNSKLNSNEITGNVKDEATTPAGVVPEVVGIVDKIVPEIDPEILEEIEEIEDILDGLEETTEEELALEKAELKKEADKAKRAKAARERRARDKAEREKANKGKKKSKAKKK